MSFDACTKGHAMLFQSHVILFFYNYFILFILTIVLKKIVDDNSTRLA